MLEETLECLNQIREFGKKYSACQTQFVPFCQAIDNGNYLQAWKLVAANRAWINSKNDNSFTVDISEIPKEVNGLCVVYQNDIFDRPILMRRFYLKNFNIEGKVIEYYDNGNPSREYTIKKGNCHGRFIRYNLDGSVYSISHYKNNEVHGIRKDYYGGKLYQSFMFVNGKRNGLCKTYHENGKIKIKVIYKYDDEIGRYERYHDNGKISELGNYVNGYIDGIYDYFDRKGKMICRKIYKMDTLISTEYIDTTTDKNSNNF